MITRRMTRIVTASLVLAVTGCVVPSPAKDTVSPDITVTVSSGPRGRNIFRSSDGEQPPEKSCIIVPEVPTQLVFIAGDAGGIASVSIRVFPGTILPDSVDVTPRAPEGSFAIRSESGGDTLTITLTPPSPTTVRTGATAIFEITGRLPVAIVAQARDRAGNTTNLPQFDIRGPETRAVCR